MQPELSLIYDSSAGAGNLGGGTTERGVKGVYGEAETEYRTERDTFGAKATRYSSIQLNVNHT